MAYNPPWLKDITSAAQRAKTSKKIPGEAVELEQEEEEIIPCLTFLNMTGDISISWSDENRESILELVRKKMADGYIFFTVKKVPIIGTERKVRVSKKNIDSIDKLIIPDAEFEKMAAGMNDKDIAFLVHGGKAKLGKRKDKAKMFDTIKRINKAEEVLEEQTVAIRPLAGG